MGPDGETIVDVSALAVALPALTSEAVRLGVYLCGVISPARIDAAWFTRNAEKIGASEISLRKCLKELAFEGLVDVTNRVQVSRPGTSMSDPHARIRSPKTPHSDLRTEIHEVDEGCSASEASAEGSDRGQAVTHTSAASGSGTYEQNAGARRIEQLVLDALTPGPSAARRSRRQGVRDGDPHVPHPDHTRVVNTLHELYVQRYKQKPTWDGRRVKAVRALLDLHEADEIIRRARIMFFEVRRFPEGPYDVLTLAQFFDRFAAATARGGMADVDRTRSGEGYYGEVNGE